MILLAWIVLKTGTAPYCVLTDTLKDCHYYTVGDCVKEAAAVNGVCLPNKEDQK